VQAAATGLVISGSRMGKILRGLVHYRFVADAEESG